MKVVGFGDYLMHFSPIEKMRFRQADMMQLTYTGAEANVCMVLGFWGEDVEFVTSVPGHALSEKGIAFLKSNSAYFPPPSVKETISASLPNIS